jgi:hypothetical protein
MRVQGMIIALVGLNACGEISPERAFERCEAQARAAQGPTGKVKVGVNSNTGAFTNAQIGVSTDFLRSADPDAVYDACYTRLTGQPPVRRPNLR